MSLTSDGEKLFQYALQREHLEQTLRHDLKMQPDTISGDLTVGVVTRMANIDCHNILLI